MVRSLKSLLRLINTRPDQLARIEENIDSYYYEKRISKTDPDGNPRYYNTGEPIERILHPSTGKLRNIQELLNRRIFSKISLPDHLFGSIKGKSSIKNARKHQGNKYFLLTDLKDYFPSIRNSEVNRLLLKYGFSPQVASKITRLVTYKGAIPQGAPTSPFIANLVFIPFEKEILSICTKNNIKYSRYCDDLTFSSKEPIDKEIANNILNIIRNSPYRFHHGKTQLMSGIVEINGILVRNNDLEVPESKYQKLNSLPPDSDSAKGLKSYIEQVKKA